VERCHARHHVEQERQQKH